MPNNRPTRRDGLRLLGASAAACLLAGGARAEAARKMLVHRSPTCGCCGAWVERLRKEGYAVEVVNHADMDAIKTQFGVPKEMASCHTALVEGYVVEGHAPPLAIERLLRERPKAIGLAAPGMPSGSPGMEMGESEVYTLYLFDADGAREYGKWLGDKPA